MANSVTCEENARFPLASARAGGAPKEACRWNSWRRDPFARHAQAVLVSERITGKGAVQSLDLAVGVPLWKIEPFLGAAVVGLVYVGLRFPKEKEPMKVQRLALPALALKSSSFKTDMRSC